MGDKVVVVRPPDETMSRQSLPQFVGISRETAGATGISMNLVAIPADGAAEPHLHRGYETAIYILKGRVETRYGEGARGCARKATSSSSARACPHQPVNLSATEPALAIVARNDPDEQENVVPYHPMGGG
jgi:uncharacterized RmlC-like cupin family protein